jgi:hypothetical protein
MVYGADPITQDYANTTQEARKTRLKGYGNAILPNCAAAMIRASFRLG